ncbi:MAG: hypothetical protein AAGI88_23175 [Pseudomonadota bacterium]
MNDRLPALLVIDDQPEKQKPLEFTLSDDASVVVRHPADLVEDDLIKADLVLVDYELNDWRERVEGPLGLRAYDGLALLASLRRAALRLTQGKPEHSPTAFAIYSGKLTELSGPKAPSKVPHEIARVYNLEWAFEKGRVSGLEESPLNERQFVILAKAVRELVDEWPDRVSQLSEQHAARLLGLRDADSPTLSSHDWEATWRSQGWEDAFDAYPPIFEIYERTHGLALLRWLLHRVFPYPTFLWDSRYLGARLGIQEESVKQLLSNSSLRELLADYEYRGLLAGFAGPRWWKAGIEEVLWEMTDGESANPKSIRTALAEEGISIPDSEVMRPVVCIDSEYLRPTRLSPVDSAVRVRPDDWPPFADSAWMTLDDLAARPDLVALVAPDDRHRLPI